MSTELDSFINDLHHTCEVVSRGKAVVMGNTVDAAEIKNLYGQVIVWGLFSCARGKFKGNLANNANTDEVIYLKE